MSLALGEWKLILIIKFKRSAYSIQVSIDSTNVPLVFGAYTFNLMVGYLMTVIKTLDLQTCGLFQLTAQWRIVVPPLAQHHRFHLLHCSLLLSL